MGCFWRSISPMIFYWVPFGETMTGGNAFSAGFLFSKESDAEKQDHDEVFDFMWDMLAKDFFFGTPVRDNGRRMMQGAMGGDTLGHFVPVGKNHDLRTKAGRAENYSRTEMPRWRYGEDGTPERYMEQLPKREVLPQQRKGYYGVDLSSPAWWMQYGTYGGGLRESDRLEEGVEQTLHHEAMHAAVNDELMAHYQAAVDQKAMDDFGLGDSDNPNPEQREVLQGFIDDNFFRAHEYAAHLGQEVGLDNRNKTFGRRQDGPKNRNSRHHEDAWAAYANHPGSNLSPESMAMGDEIHTARLTGIPFPPKLSDFSDEYARAEPRSEAYGGGYRVRSGPEGDRRYEDKWDEYIDPEDYYPEWDSIPMEPGSEDALFRDYRQLSPKYNSYQNDARGEISHLGHHLKDQRMVGSVNDQAGVVPDSRKAMGLRAVANAAKLMGKDFDISQFMGDRGL